MYKNKITYMGKREPTKNQNSMTRKYSHKISNDIDEFAKRSAYIKTWKERVNLKVGKINIILEFSDKLEPTDQIYSNIATELYNSHLNANIVEQRENAVIVTLRDADIILRKYKKRYRIIYFQN